MFTHLLNKPNNCFFSEFNGAVSSQPNATQFTRTEWDGSIGALNGSGALAYNSKNQGTHGDWYSKWRYNTTVGAAAGDTWDVELSWSTSYFYSTSGNSWLAFLAFSKSATSISNTNSLGVFGIQSYYSGVFTSIRYYYSPVLGGSPIVGDVISHIPGSFSGRIRIRRVKGAGTVTNVYMYYMLDGVDSEWQLLGSDNLPNTGDPHYLHYGFATGTVSNNPDVRGHTSNITRVNTLEAINVDCPSL